MSRTLQSVSGAAVYRLQPPRVTEALRPNHQIPWLLPPHWSIICCPGCATLPHTKAILMHQSGHKPLLLDMVRHQIRLKHYSIRTEEAYVQTVKRFILFHGKRHPSQMGTDEMHLLEDGDDIAHHPGVARAQ